MQMFLASTLGKMMQEFDDFVPSDCNRRVMFIANPSDPFSDKEWVNEDKIALRQYKYKVFPIDLRKHNSNSFLDFIEKNDIDILYVSGGSAIYMMDLLRARNLLSVFRRVIQDNLIYCSTSAGTMITSNDLSFCKYDADELEARIDIHGKMRGLGLVPFYFFCHSEDAYYIDSTKSCMDHLCNNKQPILMLNDNMALIVRNNRFKIIIH